MSVIKNLTTLLLLFSSFTAASCKKESGGSTAGTAPTNLMVNAVVNADGSGNVSFTATATNAVSFDYEFGDGGIATGTNGSASNRYTLAGTNTYSVKVTAKGNTGLTTTKTIGVTVTVTAGTPTLIWSDEFNTDGLPDPAKWGYDLGAGGWGNNEAEYYTSRSANAVVINGVLKITAIKELAPDNVSAYTSARLLTKDKFAFKYGKVEIRAKLPAGGGTWPALWMLGSDVSTTGWPGCGEIDIMEHLGNDLNKIYGTLHYPGHSGGNADGGNRTITNATTEFHIYSVEWTAAAVTISVDGQLIHSVANSASIPFNHNFFLIANVAMGGGFGGTIDPAFTSASMEVDYIRVYQ